MSKIEWTDDTANIFVVMVEGRQKGHYCIKVSPACAGCYAEKFNQNAFFGGNGLPYKVLPESQMPEFMVRRDILDKWVNGRSKRVRLTFVNSMTDTFADFYPEQWVYDLFDAMAAARGRVFQVLTKRAERMNQLVHRWLEMRQLTAVPDHIWIGVSVENQKYADERIPWLIDLPCIRFLSVEPMLGPVNLMAVGGDAFGWGQIDSLAGTKKVRANALEDGSEWETAVVGKIHWVIAGGESGKNARPTHPYWLLKISNQCLRSQTPFFFKQWGEWLPISDLPDSENYSYKTPEPTTRRLVQKLFQETKYTVPVGFLHGNDGKFVSSSLEAEYTAERECMMFYRVGKKVSGRLLAGRTWNQYPAVLEGIKNVHNHR